MGYLRGGDKGAGLKGERDFDPCPLGLGMILGCDATSMGFNNLANDGQT